MATTKIHKALALINKKINQQLNCLLHHPRFQQLEASWRGIHLLSNSIDHTIQIKLLDLSWQELTQDINHASDYDQTHLFNKIYYQEFDQPGGEPIGLLLGDYYFSGNKTTLETLMKIAASAFSPCVLSISPALLHLEDMKDLSKINIKNVYSSTQKDIWKKIQNNKEAYFLSLVAPQILLRLPHSPNKLIPFTEETSATQDYLWGNAVYFYAAALINHYKKHAWFPDRPLTIPHHLYTKISHFYFTNTRINNTQEKQLNELGVTYFNECHYQTQITYNYHPSLYTQNTSLSFHHILCFVRFIHYIKIIGRNKVGLFQTPLECEKFMQGWLHQYTAEGHALDEENKCLYPLQKACIYINFYPGDNKKYDCEVDLSLQTGSTLADIKLRTTTEIPR